MHTSYSSGSSSTSCNRRRHYQRNSLQDSQPLPPPSPPLSTSFAASMPPESYTAQANHQHPVRSRYMCAVKQCKRHPSFLWHTSSIRTSHSKGYLGAAPYLCPVKWCVTKPPVRSVTFTDLSLLPVATNPPDASMAMSATGARWGCRGRGEEHMQAGRQCQHDASSQCGCMGGWGGGHRQCDIYGPVTAASGHKPTRRIYGDVGNRSTVGLQGGRQTSGEGEGGGGTCTGVRAEVGMRMH